MSAGRISKGDSFKKDIKTKVEEEMFEEAVDRLKTNVKGYQEGLCLNIRETTSVLKPTVRTYNNFFSLEGLLFGLITGRN